MSDARIAALLDRCRWPDLPMLYDRALREALAFVLERVPDVLGIVASGTIIRGEPSRSSDLDIYVLRAASRRQRIQRFFSGVPAEILINPYRQVLVYLAEERIAARPITAHLLTSGFTILALDSTLDNLKARAAEALALPPALDAERRTTARYMAATRFEDALDVVETRPETATLILGLTVVDMLRYAFMRVHQYVPRDKDLVVRVAELDPQLGDFAQRFFASATLGERLRWADEIAARTIETRGFFEWESQVEELG